MQSVQVSPPGGASTGWGATESGSGEQREAFRRSNLLTCWNIFEQRTDFGKLYFGKITLAGVWGKIEGGECRAGRPLYRTGKKQELRLDTASV